MNINSSWWPRAESLSLGGTTPGVLLGTCQPLPLLLSGSCICLSIYPCREGLWAWAPRYVCAPAPGVSLGTG